MQTKILTLLIFLLNVTLIFSQQDSKNNPPQELSLQQAIQIALKQNPMLKAVQEDINIATSKQKQAVAMTKPSISASTYLTSGNNTSIFTTPVNVMPQSTMTVPTKTFLNANISAMYPLYTGGRLKAMVKFSDIAIDISKQNFALNKLDTILMVQEAYRMALLAKELIKVYEELVARSEEQLRIDKTAFKVGKIPQYYIYRDEAEVADAKQMLADRQKEFDTAMIELKTVLALDQNQKITLSDSLTYEALEENLEKLTSEALKNNPEIIALAKMIEQTKQEILMVESEFKPQISVAIMSDTMKEQTMPWSSRYSVGIVGALPIYDAGLRKEKKQTALNMLKKTQAELAEKKLQIISQINKLYLALQTAEKNIKTSETVLASVKEDYRIARLRYESGKGIQVEVLDASFSLLRAQTNNLQALYDYLITKDRLIRVVGKE